MVHVARLNIVNTDRVNATLARHYAIQWLVLIPIARGDVPCTCIWTDSTASHGFKDCTTQKCHARLHVGCLNTVRNHLGCALHVVYSVTRFNNTSSANKCALGSGYMSY